MQTTARAASRASTAFRSSAARHTVQGAKRAFHQGQRPFASSTTSRGATSFPTSVFLSSAVLLAGGSGLYAFSKSSRPTFAESPTRFPDSTSEPTHTSHTAASSALTQQNYQAVYDHIAQKLIDEDDYDDGSFAPVLLRLGWHSSGSYDAATGTGGSNGATMRFPPEGELPANSGLRYARDFLEPVKDKFRWISYSDLWTLAAVCAIQEMGGPTVPWRPGRQDKDVSFCSPDGRLPDGSKEQNHVRRIFGRMGFDDQEMVAMIGAHAVGRCHVDRSGFEGPWTFSPITFTNDFYRLLLEEEWHERDWNGQRQFQDDGSKSLMMLPTDYCLVQDREFKGWVERYAADQDVFFQHFSKAVVKLFELGVPFPGGDEERRLEFARSE